MHFHNLVVLIKNEFIHHGTPYLSTRKSLKELPFSSQYYQYTTSDGSIGSCITPTPMVRDLGINIYFSWLDQYPCINIISDSARKMSAWALSVFFDLSPSTMTHLYKSLICSKVESVMGPLSNWGYSHAGVYPEIIHIKNRLHIPHALLWQAPVPKDDVTADAQRAILHNNV